MFAHKTPVEYRDRVPVVAVDGAYILVADHISNSLKSVLNQTECKF